MADNPYQAPDAENIGVGKFQYSHGQMMCATFFASIILAGIMLSRNWSTAGDSARASRSLATCMAIGIIGLIGCMFIPGHLAGFAFTIICMVMVSRYFKNHLSKPYRDSTRRGVAVHSNWRVFGMILLCLLIIFAVAFGIAFSAEMLGMSIPE